MQRESATANVACVIQIRNVCSRASTPLQSYARHVILTKTIDRDSAHTLQAPFFGGSKTT